jgi:phosphoglycerol transferase MdoB-like AlkP superfamily enzyme
LGLPSVSASSAFFAVLVILALLKSALMRHWTLGGWNFVLAVALEGAFVVVVLCLFDLIPPRRTYWVDLLAYSALSVLMFALTVYVSYYSQLFNPTILAVAGQLTTVGGQVKLLIRPSYTLFFIDIPFLALWAFFLRKSEKARAAGVVPDVIGTRSHEGGRRRAGGRPGRSRVVAALLALSAVALGVQLFLVHQLPSWVDGVAIAKARGLVVAQLDVFWAEPASTPAAETATPTEVDAPTTGTVPAASEPATEPTTAGGKTQAKIDRIRGAQQGSRIATFPVGAYRGQNLIIIQVESLNTFVLQKKYEGQELTPNLNKLIGESWYFPNTYSQTGVGNTADAEFVVNTSLYTPRIQAAPVQYASRTIPGLPRLLTALGYDTWTIHPNTIAYWNRNQLYPAIGWTHYYDKPYFNGVDPIGEFGSSDEELVKRSLELVSAAEASGTPFYAQVITLSAHGPYDGIPESRRPVKTPADLADSELMGKYISAQSYGDMAVGKFIDGLKASGAWDNSIVMVYGDHSGMMSNDLKGEDAMGARRLLGRSYGPADRQRVALLIHLPHQTEGVTRQDVVGQVDFMPTVADLLGMDLTEVPHMGRSVFVESNALVPLRAYLPGGTFVNGRVVFMPGLDFSDGTAAKVSNDAETKPTEADKIDFQRTQELTDISDAWVMSLPKRADAGKMGWIPDKKARKLARPFGATQSGGE